MSWRVEVRIGGDGWFSNPLRFPTEQEASWYAVELVKRWSAIAEVRTAETQDAVTHLCSPHGAIIKWTPNGRE